MPSACRWDASVALKLTLGERAGQPGGSRKPSDRYRNVQGLHRRGALLGLVQRGHVRSAQNPAAGAARVALHRKHCCQHGFGAAGGELSVGVPVQTTSDVLRRGEVQVNQAERGP